MRSLLLLTLAALTFLTWAPVARAANEGQADLDKATELQIGAETLADLEKVIELGESALKKGLDKDQAQFARQIVAATLNQHATRLVASIFEQKPPTARWKFVREQALLDLEKAQKYDPELFDAPLLIARLQALPDGDKQAGAKAIDNAIRILKTKDEPKLLAKAYVLRAATSEDAAAQLEDFQAAAKADPESAEALQGLSLIYLSQGKNEEAVAALRKLVETGSGNPAAIGILAEALTNQKKYDEALEYANKLIEVKPKATLGYQLRARIHILKEDLKAANEDLDEALKVDGEDVQSLLLRSQVLAALGKDEQAKADIDKAVRLDPDQPQAILFRAMVAAQSGDFGRAITDMQTLIHSDPGKIEYRLRLATFYNADKRPRKAIQILDDVIHIEPQNAEALQARGDAYLSISKQKEAIADYEKSLKIEGDNTGVLNNLAWVMSTSPEAELRNGKRAIELATKACELTKFEKPHILSTLASAYAEAGDWANAVKWSSKAVELGDGEIKDQLKEELKSYQEKKPWRESQTVEENTAPIEPKKDDLET